MPPFVVFALPRSRTAWLARYLSYRDWHCGHDEARYARSVDDLTGWLAQPNTGTVETAAAPFWRTLMRLRPDALVVTVRRPVAEVVDSLMRLPVGFHRANLRNIMETHDRNLDQIERRIPGVVSVPFADLAREEVCKRVFTHCLPYAHDPVWWRLWADTNVQISMPAMVRYYLANQAALERLAAQLKRLTLSDMTQRAMVSADGMTFQTEDFATWLRDGATLFAEHLTAVGEHPDSVMRKNIGLMQRLDDIGAMQILTARANGRMFGYLMTIVAPSLEGADILTATHTTFYASKDAPGLGLKLQRAALDGLRKRGVDEVFMRAGVRGSGARMGAFYRRLGAEDFGQMFKLDLVGA